MRLWGLTIALMLIVSGCKSEDTAHPQATNGVQDSGNIVNLRESMFSQTHAVRRKALLRLVNLSPTFATARSSLWEKLVHDGAASIPAGRGAALMSSKELSTIVSKDSNVRSWDAWLYILAFKGNLTPSDKLLLSKTLDLLAVDKLMASGSGSADQTTIKRHRDRLMARKLVVSAKIGQNSSAVYDVLRQEISAQSEVALSAISLMNEAGWPGELLTTDVRADIEKWLFRSGSEPQQIRLAAAITCFVGTPSPHVVEFIDKAAANADESVNQAIWYLLKLRIDDSEESQQADVRKILLIVGNSEDLRDAVVDSLIDFHPSLLTGLNDLLMNNEERIGFLRFVAAAGLAQESSVQDMYIWLKNKQAPQRLRTAAACALASVGTNKDIDSLRKILEQESDQKVYEAIATAIQVLDTVP